MTPGIGPADTDAHDYVKGSRCPSTIGSWLAFGLVICAIRLPDAEAARLYVAPNGRADWSGSLADAKADQSDGPLPSIVAARDLIRAGRARGEWPDEAITVLVRGGTYHLTETIVFEAQDSGSPGKPVTYAAYGDEKPVLSGGRLITGWRAGEVNSKACWVATIPGGKHGRWYFRQLFVNGQRRHRPRVPQEGYYRLAALPNPPSGQKKKPTSDTAYFRPGDLRNWRNLADVEYVSMEVWDESHLFLKEIDEAAHRVRFNLESYFLLGTTKEGQDILTRYYLKNIMEELDDPGEWYLDRATGLLCYMPIPGESPETAEVIAPFLDDLLRIAGDPDRDRPVHDLCLKGLTFSHNDWWLPPGERQGGQAARLIPGAITLQSAVNCRIDDCTVTHVSNYAIELRAGCVNNLVSGCTLTDLGAGGVKIGHDSSHTMVTDCEIGDAGIIHHGAVGIWVGDSWANTVSHNHVHHLNYSGISVGWTWGYRPSKAACNTVEYNHVHHVGQGMLSDLAGIYTLGISPGTAIRFNLIHDVQAYDHAGRGIYNDEGSSFILVENNIVYRTSQSAYHLNYGRENTIRNNVFICGTDENVTRSGQEEHLSFSFERNLVYITASRVFDGQWRWDKGHFRMDHNLYYREGGQAFDFPGDRTFAQWQEWSGQDRNSVIADPLFVDLAKDDFTVKPGSPAERIGFKPIDMTRVGRLRTQASRTGN